MLIQGGLECGLKDRQDGEQPTTSLASSLQKRKAPPGHLVGEKGYFQISIERSGSKVDDSIATRSGLCVITGRSSDL